MGGEKRSLWKNPTGFTIIAIHHSGVVGTICSIFHSLRESGVDYRIKFSLGSTKLGMDDESLD